MNVIHPYRPTTIELQVFIENKEKQYFSPWLTFLQHAANIASICRVLYWHLLILSQIRTRIDIQSNFRIFVPIYICNILCPWHTPHIDFSQLWQPDPLCDINSEPLRRWIARSDIGPQLYSFTPSRDHNICKDLLKIYAFIKLKIVGA